VTRVRRSQQEEEGSGGVRRSQEEEKSGVRRRRRRRRTIESDIETIGGDSADSVALIVLHNIVIQILSGHAIHQEKDKEQQKPRWI